MSQSDRAIKKLATQLARIDREVKSWRGAQADYTSIEAGTMDINDSDGNLVSRVGFQDDGSGTVRFFDGPTPPAPAGVTATADGPIIQATWDGTFEGGAEATYDLAYLEVAATQVDDASNVSFATITAKEGASASVVADVTGDWVVAVRSVSQAGKKSEFATAGTVEVKVTDLSGAIEDVQQSANGKNNVTYSEFPPKEEDAGIPGDTWFVGTADSDTENPDNVLTNGSFENGTDLWNWNSTRLTVGMSPDAKYGDASALLTATASATTSTFFYPNSVDLTPGQWVGFSQWVKNSNGAPFVRSRVIFYNSSNSIVSSPYVSAMTQTTGEWAQLIGAVQVPANAAYGYFYIYLYDDASGSAPPAGKAVLTDGWVIAFGASQVDALSKSSLFFLQGGWNIVAQYQYTADGWTQVELSHEVIATVDLGKATVGELDGIRIMAKTISGDLFAGDAFDGIVFRGNTFTTRDGNGEFSDRGLFFQKPDGTAIFRVPTDGTPISMSASDVQIERAQVDELDLNIGRVRSGGLFELSSGVTPPAAPPELNAAWKRATTLAQPESDHNYDWTGLARWGDKWVRGVNVLGAAGDDLDRIEIYNPDGTLDRAIPTQINPRAGVTVIGDTVYTIGPAHDPNAYHDNYLHGYDLSTGNRTMWAPFSRFTAKGQKQYTIGTDGTNIIVAGVTPTPNLYVMKYDPATGAQIGGEPNPPSTGGDMIDWDWNLTARDLFGVHQDGSDLYITHKGSTRVYTVSGYTLTRKPGLAAGLPWDGWRNPNSNAGGMTFVDGKPFVVDGSGTIFEGSTRASDYTAEVCYTWYDGTHETTPSPVATIDVAARETVTITLPYREGLGKRVYYRGAGGTNWVRENVAENVTSTPLPVGVAYFQPPTTNSFPNADPAVFRSTNGNVIIRGDGSGNWGPLTFNTDGTVTGIPKMASGTLDITPTAANTPREVWVTFPEGRFTAPPTVVVSARTTVPGTRVTGVGSGGQTASGFYAYLTRTDTTATGFNWIATEEG